MNVRELLDISEDYAAFNREERHLAAIFFHALHLRDNLRRFVELVAKTPIAQDFDPSVAFEFAYLRDAWRRVRSESTKRGVIKALLPETAVGPVADGETYEFNKHFGAVPKPSRQSIQSPSNWSVARFDSNLPDNSDFLAICRLKWAFNSKPDLVIRTGEGSCICIEAKLESGEGTYPGTSAEKQIFRRRGIDYVTQTALQRYMLEELLGFETTFLFLALKPPAAASSHKFLSWAEAFETFRYEELPAHMVATIRAMAHV